MAFPSLNELVAAQNSNNLTNVIKIEGHRLLIAELNVFGGPLAMQRAEFPKQLSQTEVLNKLEIRKTIEEVHIQVHKKIDFLIVMRLYLLGFYVHGDSDVGTWVAYFVDPRLQSKRSALDTSFTLGSTEEADNVKILQSCNGLLLCSAYMLHPEGKLFESRWCLLLVCRVDTGFSEFTIYEMMIGCSVWMVRCRVDIDDFMTPLLEGWSICSRSIVLGEREQDSFLVINLSGKVV
ncbi:hypothetical protein Tco_0980537 [Tanacetum coccineum]